MTSFPAVLALATNVAKENRVATIAEPSATKSILVDSRLRIITQVTPFEEAATVALTRYFVIERRRAGA